MGIAGCTSHRCLLSFYVSSSNSAITRSLCSMKKEDSVPRDQGLYIYSSIHLLTHLGFANSGAKQIHQSLSLP